ncbi:MAG: hypothetical protein FD165_1165 [Gammaproteobacteria bacterium]|nr:MAG: hypothetical protein FD165_1165 [Gammaproteobacteria bacterium]TND07324.1 MAG: hypothetical protein FD120_62 [Gammaproteobacteria bacterium]
MSVKRERLHRTFAYAYLATGLAQCAEIGFSYILFKSFEPAQIGLYGWAAALIAFFGVAVDLGLESLMVRRISEGGVRLWDAIGAACLVRLPVILVGALLLVVLAQGAVIGAEASLFLAVMGSQVVFNVWDGVCRAWLRAHDRQTAANVTASCLSILRMLLILGVSRIPGTTLLDVVAGLLLVRLVTSITFYLWARQTGPAVQSGTGGVLKLAAVQVRTGVSLGLISLLTVVQNRLDWLLIDRFVSLDALASYSMANKLYEISQVLVGVAITTLYPLLCRTQHPARVVHELLLRLVVAFGILLGIGGLFTLPDLLDAIFDGKFGDIGVTVRLMMIAVGFMALSGILYNLALARGMERKLLLVAGLVTATQALSNYWLIQQLGIVGAAAGMLVLVVGTSSGLTILVVQGGLMSGKTMFRIWSLMLWFAALGAWATLHGSVEIWLAALCFLFTAIACWLVLFSRSERRELVAIARRMRNVQGQSG